LIATMVGIVGILLLGSLAWSAVGTLISAAGEATAALTRPSTAVPTLAPVAAATPAVVADTPTAVAQTSTAVAVLTTPTPPVPTPTVPRPSPTSVGRNPWVLLPAPPPGTTVAPGQVTVEARGRGEAPITAIQLELDGTALAASFEQRGDSTWRGFATTRVSPGDHSVRAVVTDAQGRSGSFRWTFSAKP
jgi:hypothetical protein